MNEREKLIDLILNAPRKNEVYGIKLEKPVQTAQTVADHLLANGVIVPPCKVGQKVYFAGFDSGVCLNGSLVSYCLDAAHLWFNCHYDCGLNYWHPIEDFGKTVFLTQEEAKKALAERGKQ